MCLSTSDLNDWHVNNGKLAIIGDKAMLSVPRHKSKRAILYAVPCEVVLVNKVIWVELMIGM